MVKDVLKDLEKKMKSSLEHFRKELGRVRTGRANLGIFEEIKKRQVELPSTDHRSFVLREDNIFSIKAAPAAGRMPQ